MAEQNNNRNSGNSSRGNQGGQSGRSGYSGNNQGKPERSGPVDRTRYPKIQAYLSKLGVVSRRKAEDLIKEKKIQVNGVVAKIGQRIKAGEDVIVVDGKKVESKRPPEPIYILLYKPVGIVSSANDDKLRKTVLDLVPDEKERLYPVGRLDMDSEGLMILTNDGDFTFKMTHPSNEVQKTYQVLLGGRPSTRALDMLQRGVKLKEGYFQPDEMRIVKHEGGNTWLEIVIHEGKNRLVRRMMRRIGYPVIRLVRTKMGPFDMDMLGGRPHVKLDRKEVLSLVGNE